MTTGLARMHIGKNGAYTWADGLNAVGSPPDSAAGWISSFMSVSGSLQLNPGDYMSVWYATNDDAIYTRTNEGGFSCTMLQSLKTWYLRSGPTMEGRKLCSPRNS